MVSNQINCIFANQNLEGKIPMNISRENIDKLNAIVKVDIKKEDYEPKVTKILKDYRKTANIPGFRKGHVPMGLIKKQYGHSVLVDEVNKLLQENLNKYIVDEKLDVLGNPLPKAQDNFSWDTEDYSFEFEIGLAPEFEVDVKAKKPITSYKIIADQETIDKQVEYLRTQYGKMISKNEVEEGNNITGVFTSEEKEIEKESTFSLDNIKGKRNLNKFLGSKVGDTLTFKTKNLFDEVHLLEANLGLETDEGKDLNIEVNFEIKEINEQELAELNQDFFDKIFGKDKVKSEEEFQNKIKEDIEKQFEQQSNQQLINDVTEALLEETKFDLPDEFLTKWIQVSGEKELTEEEAKEEYQRSEKALRFQLIENELMKANDIKVEMEDVLASAKERIKMQMAQFGQMNPSEEELNSIAQRVLSNEQEARNFSDQVKNEKLLDFYKENANLKEKEVTYDDFIKEVMDKK